MKKVVYEGLPEGLYGNEFSKIMSGLDGNLELASSFNEDDGDLSVLWYQRPGVAVRFDHYPSDKKSKVKIFGDGENINAFEIILANPEIKTNPEKANSKQVYVGDDTILFGLEPFMGFMDSLPEYEVISETGSWASGIFDHCHIQWLQRPGIVVSYFRVDKRIRKEGNLVTVKLIGDVDKIGVLEQTILDEAKKL